MTIPVRVVISNKEPGDMQAALGNFFVYGKGADGTTMYVAKK